MVIEAASARISPGTAIGSPNKHGAPKPRLRDRMMRTGAV